MRFKTYNAWDYGSDAEERKYCPHSHVCFTDKSDYWGAPLRVISSIYLYMQEEVTERHVVRGGCNASGWDGVAQGDLPVAMTHYGRSYRPFLAPLCVCLQSPRGSRTALVRASARCVHVSIRTKRRVTKASQSIK